MRRLLGQNAVMMTWAAVPARCEVPLTILWLLSTEATCLHFTAHSLHTSLLLTSSPLILLHATYLEYTAVATVALMIEPSQTKYTPQIRAH